MQGRMLRTSRYKYVTFSEGRNPEMFFDLEQDPGETHNLVPTAAAATELDRHRALLQQWCEHIQDPFAATDVLRS